MGRHTQQHIEKFRAETRAHKTFKAKAKCPKCEIFHIVLVGAPAVKLLYLYCNNCKKLIEGEDVYGYNQGYY